MADSTNRIRSVFHDTPGKTLLLSLLLLSLWTKRLRYHSSPFPSMRYVTCADRNRRSGLHLSLKQRQCRVLSNNAIREQEWDMAGRGRWIPGVGILRGQIAARINSGRCRFATPFECPHRKSCSPVARYEGPHGRVEKCDHKTIGGRKVAITDQAINTQAPTQSPPYQGHVPAT